jgi:polysaccharide export outer membrane protein
MVVVVSATSAFAQVPFQHGMDSSWHGPPAASPMCAPCAAPHVSHTYPVVDMLPWQAFAHGEYVGPARTVHVDQYRLRVDDQLEFVYRFTHEANQEAYRLDVGDEVVIESLTDETLNRGDLTQGRGLVIQPDGTITLRLLGQVVVAGSTVEEVRAHLEEAYKKYYTVPAITVTPLKTNTRLEDLRDSIDNRFGEGGQLRRARVTPEGTVQLPGVGSIPTHGLTLCQVEREIEERYRQLVGPGVEVTPVLVARAPRYIYVLGEVANPGRFTLEAPTTLMQAIALAGSYRNGGDLRDVVVFRRGCDWRLLATKLNIRPALFGKRRCLADEIWLRDSDVVVVPENEVLQAANFIDLVFTRSIYGVLPISVGIAAGSSL